MKVAWWSDVLISSLAADTVVSDLSLNLHEKHFPEGQFEAKGETAGQPLRHLSVLRARTQTQMKDVCVFIKGNELAQCSHSALENLCHVSIFVFFYCILPGIFPKAVIRALTFQTHSKSSLLQAPSKEEKQLSLASALEKIPNFYSMTINYKIMNLIKDHSTLRSAIQQTFIEQLLCIQHCEFQTVNWTVAISKERNTKASC